MFHVHCVLQEPSDVEKEYLTSRQWGSLFTDDHTPADTAAAEGKRPMNTLWGYIIRKYADVAVPQLEHISGQPPLQNALLVLRL